MSWDLNTKKRVAFCFAMACLAVSFLSVAVLADKALFWRSERDALWNQATDESARDQGICESRVLFLGDSIWAAYPTKVLLPRGITVVNKGVPGALTKSLAASYRAEAATIPHDILILEGGINDILGCAIYGANEQKARKEIIKSYRDIVSTATNAGKKVVVCSILPVNHRFLLPYYRLMRIPTPFDVKWVNQFVQSMNTELQRIADEFGVEFCDLHRVVVDSHGRFHRSFAVFDGIHVNVLGYKAVTGALMPVLARLCD